jgi:hypothetical protein
LAIIESSSLLLAIDSRRPGLIQRFLALSGYHPRAGRGTSSGSVSSSPVDKAPRLDPGLDLSEGGRAFEVAVALAWALGLLAGLASYHGVLTDIPLPSSIYKTMVGAELDLEDLFEVDRDLAKSLQFLLNFEEGSIQEVFATTFTSSANPLLSNRSAAFDDQNRPSNNSRFVELVPGGFDTFVDRGNRGEFVKLFVKNALYESCRECVDAYLKGVTVMFTNRIIGLCTYDEVSV